MGVFLSGIGLVFLFIAIFILLAMWASRFRKVGPNEVLVIFGRKRAIVDPVTGERKMVGYRLIRGGGAFIWPIVESYKSFSLELITIDIQTPEIYTKQAIPIMIDAVAQIKVKNDEISIGTAVEQFLGKTVTEMAAVAKQTLEGHLRAIIGDLSVEEINTDRDQFARRVQEVSAPDLANMGLCVISFTIQDIKDNVGYLVNLGKPRVAYVKKEAAIAEAEAQRDAQIKASLAKKEGEQARLLAETEIARATRDFETKKAEFTADVNLKKAEADLAYDLQKFKKQQEVKAEEIKVKVVEKERLVDVEEKEILRKEKELIATVKKPAEAKQFEIETLARAEQTRLQTVALGQAEAVKLQGIAQAEVIKATGLAEAEAVKAKGLAQAEIVKAQGLAEAEAMASKAASWSKYTESALVQIIAEKLPDLAREIASPLSKTEKIIIINQGGDGSGAGASKITQDITTIISQLPPVVESLTGVKLTDMIKKVPGLTELTTPAPPKEKK